MISGMCPWWTVVAVARTLAHVDTNFSRPT
jgi:hypothetical protein